VNSNEIQSLCEPANRALQLRSQMSRSIIVRVALTLLAKPMGTCSALGHKVCACFNGALPGNLFGRRCERCEACEAYMYM
jgi:hypothetical protein